MKSVVVVLLKVAMGRYFGLQNYTKHHNVSSYWKGSPPTIDDVKKIAKILSWDLENDAIRASCYDTLLIWKNGKWEDVTWKCFTQAMEQDLEDEKYEKDEREAVECVRFLFDGWDVKEEIEWKSFGVTRNRRGQVAGLSQKTFSDVFFCN